MATTKKQVNYGSKDSETKEFQTGSTNKVATKLNRILITQQVHKVFNIKISKNQV